MCDAARYDLERAARAPTALRAAKDMMLGCGGGKEEEVGRFLWRWLRCVGESRGGVRGVRAHGCLPGTGVKVRAVLGRWGWKWWFWVRENGEKNALGVCAESGVFIYFFGLLFGWRCVRADEHGQCWIGRWLQMCGCGCLRRDTSRRMRNWIWESDGWRSIHELSEDILIFLFTSVWCLLWVVLYGLVGEVGVVGVWCWSRY